VLIFTQRRFDPGLPNHFQDYANGSRLRRIYLDELPDDLSDRSIELGVLQLMGLQDELAPQRARELLQRARVTDGVDEQRLLELVLRTFVYKFSTLTREEIRLMLGIDELKQTRFYQEMAQEEQEKGREEGREEGVQQGVQQMLSRTVPVLLRAGLSIDQIAQQLQVDVELVRKAAQQN